MLDLKNQELVRFADIVLCLETANEIAKQYQPSWDFLTVDSIMGLTSYDFKDIEGYTVKDTSSMDLDALVIDEKKYTNASLLSFGKSHFMRVYYWNLILKYAPPVKAYLSKQPMGYTMLEFAHKQFMCIVGSDWDLTEEQIRSVYMIVDAANIGVANKDKKRAEVARHLEGTAADPFAF